MTEADKYKNYREVYSTVFLDYSRDMMALLAVRGLDVVEMRFFLDGWGTFRIKASPADYDKAVAAVEAIKKNSVRAL